jgi:serine/threonine-protein kinase
MNTDAFTAGNQSGDSLIGHTIDNKYRIESKLGEGGMGAVYLSTRLMIGDTVAVKILHSAQVSDPQAIERFRREAQAAARLKHQNAVTIYDFGVSNEGLVYLVMELAEGQSLRDIIKQQGPVTPSAAAEIMSQVCAALDAAHRQNIVHRDLKPDNIIVAVTNTGLRAKVLDFGIAKMRDLSASNLTQTGAVMGTPYYMSPEHCMGEELDHRSDIYSLGIVLFEMLAGVVPFNSPISTAVIVQHVNQAAPSLRALNASISASVEAVVMHALEKRREARQQTAVQLAQELIAAVEGRPFTPQGGSIPVSPFYSTPASTTPAASPVAGAGLAPTIQMTTPPALSGARTAAPAKNRLPLKLRAAVVIMVVVVIIGLLIWASQSGQDANAPSLTVDPGIRTALSETKPTQPDTKPIQSTDGYTINSCGSITDNKTGLEWYIGPDQNMTWPEAAKWVRNMDTCGRGWRMPTISELRALYNPNFTAGTGYFTAGRYWPAHLSPVFAGIGGGSWVWSKEMQQGGNAHSFNFNQGAAVTYSQETTAFSTRAFAVR